MTNLRVDDAPGARTRSAACTSPNAVHRAQVTFAARSDMVERPINLSIMTLAIVAVVASLLGLTSVISKAAQVRQTPDAALAAKPGAAGPRFDVVSIKPSTQNRNGPVQFTPGRAFSNSVSPYRMILAAYHLKEYQLIGVTGWMSSDWFALEAKAGQTADENQLRLMLQTALAERFRMVVHHETRTTPIYALIPGKKGTKLRQWKEGDPIPSGATGISIANLSHETMESLVDLLNLPGFQKASGVDRPVLDKTGLKGEYLVLSSWYDSWEDFPTAVLEGEMGLKLVPRKTTMDVLVIDHLERPSNN